MELEPTIKQLDGMRSEIAELAESLRVSGNTPLFYCLAEVCTAIDQAVNAFNNRKQKVIIAGSRSFMDYPLLVNTCGEWFKIIGATTVISGGAAGADSLGEKFAKEYGYELITRPADWIAHGKAAGPIRNAQMADEADAAIIFWDGESKGSKNMIDEMRKRNKPYRVIYSKP